MTIYLLQRVSQVRRCLSFLILLKFNDNLNVSEGKEMTENINSRSETKFASVEDYLNMHRTASSETTLVSEILNITNDENVIIAPGQVKKPV